MGLKKSEFTADTTIPAGSTFDFVINGQNFKITIEDLISYLGVTGSLSQDGAVSGAPVLDLSSAPDYLIRNLEEGEGISVSVSPENGITIELSNPDVWKPVAQKFSSSGTINDDTTLAISNGTNTLIMPTVYDLILDVKAASGTVTLDPGVNTVENGNTVTATVDRRFYLDGTVWLEL